MPSTCARASYLEPGTQVREAATLGTVPHYRLANGLPRFRTPMLFVISGYLPARRAGTRPLGPRLWRCLRTFLPYLPWSVIWLAPRWALEQFAPSRQAIIDAQISPRLAGAGGRAIAGHGHR